MSVEIMQQQDELSIAQINDLLKDAEQRLRASASNQALAQEKPKNSLLTKSTRYALHLLTLFMLF